MLVLLALLLQAPTDVCPPAAMSALSQAAERRDESGAEAAGAPLASALAAFPDCARVKLANEAITGWLAARAAAPKGGSPESLSPVRPSVEALVRLSDRAWRLHAEYARAALAAAMAAAQDERSDMSLFLTHARGLAERIALTGERAEWPAPIDEIDGELWLEVDRYQDARDAYTRAIASRPTARALIGLARTNDRLHDIPAACDAYQRAVARAREGLLEEARAYLARPECQRR